MVEQTQEKFYNIRIEDGWLVSQAAPDKATMKTPLDSVQGVQIALFSFAGQDFTITNEAAEYINEREHIYGFEIRDYEELADGDVSKES